MQESSEELEEKQKYLREEIQEKGYNTETFSDYMAQLKENGTDLNNWTLDELKQVVSSFINQENLNESNNEKNIEKGIENIRNSFILGGEKQNEKLNNNIISNNNNENPYDKIFNDKENDFKNVKNKMSDLNKEKIKIPGFEDYEIIDSSEFIDSSTDKFPCIKQKENSLSKYDNLYVEIMK